MVVVLVIMQTNEFLTSIGCTKATTGNGAKKLANVQNFLICHYLEYPTKGSIH